MQKYFEYTFLVNIKDRVEKTESQKAKNGSKWTEKILDLANTHFVLITCSVSILIGISMRVILTKSILGNLDEHEALSLLMGHDIARGKFTFLSYNSFTNGTLENILNIPVDFIFGLSKLTARIQPLIYLIATSFVLFRAFKNTPYKNTMRYVLAGLWLYPGVYVFSSTKYYGTIQASMLLCTVILSSAYFAAHSLRNQRYFYIWAFASGIAIWNSFNLIILIFITLIWILESAPALKKVRLKPFGFFLLGLTPYALGMLINGSNTYIDSVETVFAPVVSGNSNQLQSLSQLFGGSTFTKNSFILDTISPVLFIVFILSVLFILTVFFKGLNKCSKLKHSDFGFLQLQIFVSYILVAIIFFIFSFDSSPYSFIPLIIPFLFLTFEGKSTKSFTAITLICLFTISSTSLIASASDQVNRNEAIDQTLKILKENKITKALAPHELSYLLAVKSDDKILVTPFDSNNFDLARSNNVRGDVQAIITEADNAKQNDIALCVQGLYGHAFKRLSTDDTFIYIVTSENRQKISKILNRCVNASNRINK